MGTLADIFEGSRADPSIPAWATPYIDAIRNAGSSVGIGKTGGYAKHDLKMASQGRLEELYRLAPVLSAINANKAASYNTAERVLRQNTAFEQNPAALNSAMLSEVSGNLDRNASHAFAGAAANAYSDAEHELDARNNFTDTMHLEGANDAARAAQGWTYDRSRKNGILGGLIQQWLSPKGVGSIAGLIGGASGGGPNPFASDPSICWVAVELWGSTDWRTLFVRSWLIEQSRRSLGWALFVLAYALTGRRLALAIRRHRRARHLARKLFNAILWRGLDSVGLRRRSSGGRSEGSC